MEDLSLSQRRHQGFPAESGVAEVVLETQSLPAEMENLEDEDNGDEILEMEELKELSKLYHLIPRTVVDIDDDDGNSFFRAVSFFVARNPSKHMAVRLNAVKTLKANYKCYKEQQIIVDRTLKYYTEKMSESGTIADEAIIYATAESCKIEMFVYSVNQEKRYHRTDRSLTVQTINLGCLDDRYYFPTYKGGNNMCFLISNESKKQEMGKVCRYLKEMFEVNWLFDFSAFRFTNPDDLRDNLEKSLKKNHSQACASIFVYLVPCTSQAVFPLVADFLKKIEVPKLVSEWTVGNEEMKSGSVKDFPKICRFQLKTKKDQDAFDFVKDTCNAVRSGPTLNEFSTQMKKKYGAEEFTCDFSMNGEYKISSLFSDQAMSEMIPQSSTPTSEDVNNSIEMNPSTSSYVTCLYPGQIE